MSSLDFDKEMEEAKAEEAKIKAEKQRLSTLGGVGDALANQQSFGNFFLGQMNPRNDVSGRMDKAAEALGDPMAKRKDLLERYKMAKDDSYKQKDYANKDREFDQNERKMQQERLLAKYKAAKEGSKTAFDMLPVPSQEQVKSLSGSSAKKLAIRNQLAATHKTLSDPSVPYEQRFMAAKNLMKTLNSTEGADAVGVDERNEMAGFLNTLPLGRPGFDFGPQLDKFTKQVATKVGDIDTAVESTNSQINDLMAGKVAKGAPLVAGNQVPRDKMPVDQLLKKAHADDGSEYRIKDGVLYKKGATSWERQ